MIDEILLNFVVESTIHFDESHNHVHALKVTHNAHIIMASIKKDYDKKLLTYIAMLHDVCDHKYPNSISKEKLSNFIKLNLSVIKEPIVMKIIDNISFSKEDKGLRDDITEPYNYYLLAVSDADRLEALGQVGIDRCIEFTRSKGRRVPLLGALASDLNSRVPEDVIVHCHEKLLRLVPEFFIKTEIARKMAGPLHDEIYKYVVDNSHV